jgi:hypothetical protein
VEEVVEQGEGNLAPKLPVYTAIAAMTEASDVLTCWLYRNSGVTAAAMTVPTSQNSAPQQAAAASLAIMTVARRGTVTNVTAAVWFANSLVMTSTPRSRANRTPTRCPEVIMLAAIATASAPVMYAPPSPAGVTPSIPR